MATETNDARSAGRSDRVYTELSRRLSSLELRPGVTMSENKIARSLGVSRTPVRDALHRLEREGLVENPGGGGFIVRGLVARDVREICDVLALLDGYVVERACVNLTAQGCHEVLALTAEMTRASQAGDRTAWNAVDLRFHHLLQQTADNQVVASIAADTRARVHRFWAVGVREKRLVDCSAEHSDLAQAIADGDPAMARGLAVGHVEHMRISLNELLARAAPLLSQSVFSDSDASLWD